MSLHTKELKIFNIQQLTSYSEKTLSFWTIKSEFKPISIAYMAGRDTSFPDGSP